MRVARAAFRCRYAGARLVASRRRFHNAEPAKLAAFARRAVPYARLAASSWGAIGRSVPVAGITDVDAAIVLRKGARRLTRADRAGSPILLPANAPGPPASSATVPRPRNPKPPSGCPLELILPN